MKTRFIELRVRVDYGNSGEAYLYEGSTYGIPIRYSDNPVAFPDTVLLSSITANQVKPLNLLKKFDSLIHAIKNFSAADTVVRIGEVLNATYIYPAIVKSRREKDKSITHYYQTHEARSVLEVLFFEQQNLFNRLLTMLISKNNDSCYRAFLLCLKNSVLANENVILTDDNIKNKVGIRIAELAAHLKTVSRPDVVATVGQWIQKVNAELKNYENAFRKSTGLKRDFQQLQANLALLKVLRQSDNVILPPISYADRADVYFTFLLNVLSVAALGIPLLIHKLATGKWFFTKPLSTRDHFANAQNVLLSIPEKIIYVAAVENSISKPATETVVTTPLQAITKKIVVPTWTPTQDNKFRLVVKKISDAATHLYQPDEDDKALLKNIIITYLDTGDVESFERLSAIYDAVLNIYHIECAGDPAKILNKLYTQNVPLADFIESALEPYKTHDTEAKSFVMMLKIKFGWDAADLADLFIKESLIDDAPAGTSFRDIENKIPHRSLSSLALPKYIDAVLTRIDPVSYERAKQDPVFQQAVINLVTARRRLVFNIALRKQRHVYRGHFEDLADIPHLFIKINDMVAMYHTTKLHPVLLHVAKHAFKEKMITQQPHNNRVLGQIIGYQMFKENYPEYNSWHLLPKNGGKDIGFILESPDAKQRLYVKATNNMFRELLVANMLNQLGIKMAESSLFFNEEGNYFFVTKSLTRQYRKSAGIKHKLFRPFCEAFPYDPGTETKVKYDFEKAEDHGLRDNFINDVLSHSPDLTRISFAKLLIVGEALGLNDLGGHGGNVGPIVTTYNNQTKVKIGIVDYGVYENQYLHDGSSATLKGLQLYLVSHYANSTYIFQNLVKRLTVEDIYQALIRLQLPRKYTKTQEGYLLKDEDHDKTFVEAIDAAVNETMEELEQAGVLTDAVKKDFVTYQERVVNRLAGFFNALNNPDVENQEELTVPQQPGMSA